MQRPLPLAARLPVAMALVLLLLVGCSGSSSGAPTPPGSGSPTTGTTPSVSPTFEPKPGGTLRVAGVERQVSLDPAAPGAVPVTALADVSASDASRLLGRLVLRQLYSYPAVDPVHDRAGGTGAGATQAAETRATGPSPDLAAGPPQLSDDGLTATITLRPARWDVPNPRRVTSTDVLRALKRLCLPSVQSPVRGYLAESVVGYAAACRSIQRTPPRSLAALDAVTVPGLATQGDTALVIRLIRPTNDLMAVLSLPETSPLPVEDFDGLTVTSDPLEFVGDGPYRFVATQAGETYAFSRSPSWGADPLRRAYVDHVSVRGGMSVAQVRAAIASGQADLALDVPAAPDTALPQTPTPQLVVTSARAQAIVAIGSRGPNAGSLAVPGVRRVLAACLDPATRSRIAAALGSGATATSEIAAGLSQVPAGARAPSPSPSVTPSGARTSGAVSDGPSQGPSSSSSSSSSPSPSASASVSVPSATCAPRSASPARSCACSSSTSPRCARRPGC